MSNLFNVGGFGSTTTSGNPIAFSFPQAVPGSSSPASTTFSGFGTNVTSLQPVSTGFSFGQPATPFSVAAPAFGAMGTSSQPSSSAATGFSFGHPGSAGFGAFGSPSTTNQAATGQPAAIFGQPLSLFAQPQHQQQPQHGQIDENHALYQSIFQVCKFGDERDAILARLNYLQACWGCGKGFYSQAFPPVVYSSSTPFYRFKAVGYAYIFTDNNEDGNVIMVLKKSQLNVESEETLLITSLMSMIGKPHIIFKVTGVKPIGEHMTQIVLHAEDKSTLRRVTATDLVSFFSQSHLKPQFESMGISAISPKVKPSPEQLKGYLDNPPEGIDPRVWRKAQEDNPDPISMIPIPMVGLDSLKSRIQGQQSESNQHLVRLNLISDEVGKLQNRHLNINAELQQLRRKHSELSHRVLSIIVRQEMTRKQGMTMHTDEEALRLQLEKLDDVLNSPTQFKGRVNELLSQIRLRKSEIGPRAGTKYSVDPVSLIYMKEFLVMQQESLKYLVITTKDDLSNIECIIGSASDMIFSKKG